MKKGLWINFRVAAITVVLLCLSQYATGQCSEPTKHFRSGVWKQWIYWIQPGPSALAAMQQVIIEMNHPRAAAGLPLLVFDPEEPLVVGLIEENNPRGPDGANLTNRLPNQEVFVATFAEVETGDEVVAFLTDPLRSNSELTSKGVPGSAAVFEREIRLELEGGDSEVHTKWVAFNASDQVKFSADYRSAAISARSRFPGTTAYVGSDR